MKKFFTYVSLQPKEKFNKTKYEASGNKRLDAGQEIRYPVIAMIRGYVNDGEEIKLYAIGDQKNENYACNFQFLKDDLSAIMGERSFKCEIVEIDRSEEEYAVDHLKTYSDLLNQIDENDDLYVCITYGTKPTPIIEMMVLQTAYSLKDDISIGCVAYGKYNHRTKESKVFDITALFHMSQIVTELKGRRIEHPVEFIRNMLDLEGAS